MIRKESKPLRKPQLLVFVGNPTQYHSPIFRGLSEILNGAMEVMYGDEIGAKPFYSEELASTIEWDVPILEGFPYKIFDNRAPETLKGFWSRNNPSIFPYVLRSPANYVLLHGYDTVSSWYVYVAALLSGKKIIWRGETVAKPGKERFLVAMAKRLVLPLYFLMCHKILYSCLNNRDYLAQYVLASKKFTFFPCAVDNRFFRCHGIKGHEQRKGFRRALGIKETTFVIATCSRLTQRKRTSLIINAISRMKNKNVALLVIGDGPERKNLEKIAKERGVQLVIIGFVGQREVAKHLSVSDAFALMSSYDASPKALNEALSFNLPFVVSSGVGTARDLVLHGKNGWLITPDLVNKLPEFIDQLIEEPQFKVSVAEQNGELLKRYSIKEDVRILFDVVNDGCKGF